MGKLETILTSPSMDTAGAEAGAEAAGLASGLAAGLSEEVVVPEVQPAENKSKLSSRAERLSGAECLSETIMGKYLFVIPLYFG